MRSRAVSERWRPLEGARTADEVLAGPPSRAFTLLHGAGRYEVLAEEPLFHLGAEEIEGLAWEREGEAAPLQPDLIGMVCYEAGAALDPVLPAPKRGLDPLPDLRFTVHRRLTVRDRETGQAWRADRSAEAELEPAPHQLGSGDFRAWKRADTDTPEAYAQKVAAIRHEIGRGRVYQVNLSRQESWKYRGGLALLARRLAVANPAPCSALVADPAFSILSSSPESFLRWGEGWMTARPIKGTAPRMADRAQDEAQARALLDSVKNRSELAMIVDLLRNDLSRFSGGPATVRSFPLLERYANVFHLEAEMEAILPARFTVMDLLRATFPGGSITGCPKLSAMQLIHELEVQPRRIYTGALGWMRADLTAGEWSIPIRTAWAAEEELHFGVGGGVVWDSDPRQEYEETVYKGRSLVQCLSS